MEHHQAVEPPERAPEIGGQLFGVHLPILNFKATQSLQNFLFP